jgi:hypothetical protein
LNENNEDNNDINSTLEQCVHINFSSESKIWKTEKFVENLTYNFVFLKLLPKINILYLHLFLRFSLWGIIQCLMADFLVEFSELFMKNNDEIFNKIFLYFSIIFNNQKFIKIKIPKIFFIYLRLSSLIEMLKN